MSDAIFIVGYYRSGTSALSGALQRLGVKVYNEADPNEHNPLGFYEIPELIEFDVDLFNRLGVEWTDVRGLPAGWWERADLASFLSRLEEIIRRRFTAEDPVWALKHPHLCRALPLYERAARQAGHVPHVVHIFRDPWTAAASQQHKNGLSRAHALLLWMGYVTSGERLARHLPRSWLTYHDLLAKPAEQLRRIEQDTGIGLSRLMPAGLREAAGYLTGQLNRSEALAHEDLARPLRELVTRTWEAVLARNFLPQVWDGFAAETADMVGFLTEIGSSKGKVIPAFGGGPIQVTENAPAHGNLRPAERADEGAKARLLAFAAGQPVLPSLAVIVIAPTGRAHAATDTLEALRAQWWAPAQIRIIAADELQLAGQSILPVSAEPGAASRLLCAELNDMAGVADYVAVLNAGDTVAADACLRFTLEAAQSGADIIYCDEIVPREGGAWVRHKPGWDVTRLRQSAYLGDWVWYRGETVARLGGFDATRAGAEEYDFQLRAAEDQAKVVRLTEALFTRSAVSRRDTIPAEVFCARAADAVAALMRRAGMAASVQNRQHLGLFHHLRLAPDPGTAIIMLCDGAEIAALDQWLTGLLSGNTLSGPVILTGAALNEHMVRYLTAVTQQSDALQGKVLAVMPAPGMSAGEALRQAVAMVASEYVAVLDARARPAGQHWAEALRARLADPGVALVAARALVALQGDAKQFSVQGPIIIGADTRLGAGHLADDPGPGGWLIVDQEASAVAPPALLARAGALAGCHFPKLGGDALWIDVCAQLRAQGWRIVWTPDVSFTVAPEAISPDASGAFRQGGPAARALPWADPYHHPALSLHGDLLVTEQRLGLVRAAPADPFSLLVTGPPDSGAAVLNAARALRRTGTLEADWAPEPVAAADLGRRAASAWVRVNPERAALPRSPAHRAVFCAPPGPEAKAAIAQAGKVFGTSPNLVKELRKLAGPRQAVGLWRPALSAQVWEGFTPGTGLNTRPRVLWVDEGIAPGWFADLINETLNTVAWIVVERAGSTYSGAVARIRPPESEHDWALALGELAPQIMVRPADSEVVADHYKALIGAAAGCHLLVDDRLDLPDGLGAVRLTNRIAAWQHALQHAVRDLTGTLEHGKRARAAALALPGLEEVLPEWARMGAEAVMRSAAE
jgi:hypothetical protein